MVFAGRKIATFFVIAFLIAASILSAHYAFADSTDGLVPACNAGVFPDTPISTAVLEPTSVFVFGDLEDVSSLGLTPPCALQNWTGLNNSDQSAPRAVTATASPNVISISDHPTNVTFNIQGLNLTGPFDSEMPACMPPGPSSLGSCTSGRGNIVYRFANDAGVFTGKWTVADSDNNFYFVMTRQGDCPTGLPTLTQPVNGVPCTYQITFATSDGGLPSLTTAMQVMFFTYAGGDGTGTVNGFTGYNGAADIVIPMLFTPGASTSLTLTGKPLAILSGKPVTLTATVKGTLNPSSLPQVILEDSTSGKPAFSQVQTLTTNKSGVATFKVKPEVNTSYRARLAGQAAGAQVESSVVDISVSRLVTLRATLSVKTVSKKGKKTSTTTAAFSGSAVPSKGARVLLQKFTAGTWTTIKSVTPNKSGAFSAKIVLPKGRFEWRAMVAASADYAQSISAAKFLKG